MLTKEVSQKYFEDALFSMHAKRAKSLFETSWALTKEADLTLTSLGRHKEGEAYVKHKIKSVDRLLGNRKLTAEITTVYKELYGPFLTSFPVLYIIVDWSGCCRKDTHMLRATLMHDGRGVSIYNEIHPEKKVGNAQVHKEFLTQLSRMIPVSKQVIILTDSGFVTPWFKAVEQMGWDYIGRLNTKINIRPEGSEDWIKTKTLNSEATHRVKYIGYSELGKTPKTNLSGHVYTFKEKSKKRKEKSPYPDVNKRYEASAKNAWILVSSLAHESHDGLLIKNRYKSRMQIEQNFRDDKSPRFGFGWRMGRTKDPKRIAILCLIASIAAFFLWCLGVLAEKLGLHKMFQANTQKKKRVLSHIFLAKQILLHGPPRILIKKYHEAIREIMINYKKFLCL